MPARTRPGIVVTSEIDFEDEVIVDAMGRIDFIRLAARVALRSYDVVFSLSKVEPVFGAMVELKAQFGAAIVLRDAVTQARIYQLALMIYRCVEWVAHQSAEGGGLAMKRSALPLARGV